MRTTPRIYDLAAAGLAGGLSLFELIRLAVSHGATRGNTMLSTAIGSGTFCVVLALAAIGLVLHRRLGWLLGVLGVLAAASHGIVMRVTGNWIGVGYMLASGVMLALIIKDLHGYRSPLPSET